MRSGCTTPPRPESLEGATAETITVYVRVVVGPDGRVLRARIEQSHALIPDSTVLECVNSRVYEPAHLPDGTPVPYPLRYAFTFRPDVL
jgi:outer membrane biosynthesis protein TonB